MYATNTKTPRSYSPILFFMAGYSPDTLMLMERDLYIRSYLAARRVRTEMRRNAEVGDGGGQPGRSAGEGRPILVDQLVFIELGEHDTNIIRIATGGAARYGGGDPQNKPPPENHLRKVQIISLLSRSFG
jgi:hypothetical protein